jgi:hypothetical protein
VEVVQFVGAWWRFWPNYSLLLCHRLSCTQKFVDSALIEKAELAGVDICPPFTTCLLCHQIYQQLTAISSCILTCSEIDDLLSWLHNINSKTTKPERSTFIACSIPDSKPSSFHTSQARKQPKSRWFISSRPWKQTGHWG